MATTARQPASINISRAWFKQRKLLRTKLSEDQAEFGYGCTAKSIQICISFPCSVDSGCCRICTLRARADIIKANPDPETEQFGDLAYKVLIQGNLKRKDSVLSNAGALRYVIT